MSFSQDDCRTAAEVWAKAKHARDWRQSLGYDRLPPRPAPVVQSAVAAPAPPPPPPAPLSVLPIKAPVLPPHLVADGATPAVWSVLNAAAAHFGAKVSTITAGIREVLFVRRRHVAMYVAYNATWRSLPEIGKIFKRDHTAVLHANQKIGKLIETGDPATIKDVKAIAARLGVPYPLIRPQAPREVLFEQRSSRGKTGHYSVSEKNKLKQMRAEGYNANDIALAIGRSRKSVYEAVKKLKKNGFLPTTNNMGLSA